jgi:hypothetical protein
VSLKWCRLWEDFLSIGRGTRRLRFSTFHAFSYLAASGWSVPTTDSNDLRFSVLDSLRAQCASRALPSDYRRRARLSVIAGTHPCDIE